ncbi:MAG: acetyltransferase [Candidatus Bathyarchaeota archaeon BA1]|nr:MAG: acetyltransferase [Candidatus Bathyarchaeota archaeon BA1]
MLKMLNAREGRLTDEDFRRLAEIEEHPEVARWDIPAFGGDVERAFASFKKSIENISERGDEFLVALLDGRIVGFVGIHRLKGEIGEIKHVGEVGVAVHPDFQRRGIGTKLLKACVNLARRQGFKRLEADTLAYNIAMRHILEKTGFQLEGVRRRRVRINGKYYDEACYAILISKR